MSGDGLTCSCGEIKIRPIVLSGSIRKLSCDRLTSRAKRIRSRIQQRSRPVVVHANRNEHWSREAVLDGLNYRQAPCVLQ